MAYGRVSYGYTPLNSSTPIADLAFTSSYSPFTGHSGSTLSIVSNALNVQAALDWDGAQWYKQNLRPGARIRITTSAKASGGATAGFVVYDTSNYAALDAKSTTNTSFTVLTADVVVPLNGELDFRLYSSVAGSGTAAQFDYFVIEYLDLADHQPGYLIRQSFATDYAPLTPDAGVTPSISGSVLTFSCTSANTGMGKEFHGLIAGRTYILNVRTRDIVGGSSNINIMVQDPNNSYNTIVSRTGLSDGDITYYIPFLVPSGGSIKVYVTSATAGWSVKLDWMFLEEYTGTRFVVQNFEGSISPFTAEGGVAVSYTGGEVLSNAGSAFTGIIYEKTGLTAGDIFVARGKIRGVGGTGAPLISITDSADVEIADFDGILSSTPQPFFVSCPVPADGVVWTYLITTNGATDIYLTDIVLETIPVGQLLSESTTDVTGTSAVSITNITNTASAVFGAVTGSATQSFNSFTHSASADHTDTAVQASASQTLNNFTHSASAKFRFQYFENDFSANQSPFTTEAGSTVSLSGGELQITRTTGGGGVRIDYTGQTVGMTLVVNVTMKLVSTTAGGGVGCWVGDHTSGFVELGALEIRDTNYATYQIPFTVPASGAFRVQLYSDANTVGKFDYVQLIETDVLNIAGTAAQSFNNFQRSTSVVHGVQSTSAAQSFSSFTNSASVAHGVQSTSAAHSLTTFTASASGEYRTVGTAAHSFNSFTHSATGSEVVGSASHSFNSFTNSASVTHSIGGSAAHSLTTFTHSASGSSVVGTAAHSFNSFTASGAGSHSRVGTAAQSFNSFTHSATGSSVVGTAAHSLTTFVNSASVVLGNSASASHSLTTFTHSATGYWVVAGTASHTFNSFTHSATGSSVRGTAAQSFTGFVNSATGVFVTLGDSVGVLNSFVHSASGARGAQGSKAASFGLSHSATGAMGLAGTFSYSFNNFVHSAAGSQPIYGSATQTFTVLQSALGQSGEIIPPVIGTAAHSVPRFHQGSEGGHLFGTAAQTISQFNQNAQASIPVEGSSVRSFNNFQHLAQGYRVVFGTATQTILTPQTASGQHFWGTGVATQTFSPTQTATGVQITTSTGATQTVVGFSQSANGVLISEASGNGLFNAFGQSANGTIGHQGSAEQVVLFLSAANGQAGVQGNAEQTVAVFQVAQGYRLVSGTSAATFSVVHYALGERIIQPYNQTPDPTRTTGRPAELRSVSYPAQIRTVSFPAEIRKVG